MIDALECSQRLSFFQLASPPTHSTVPSHPSHCLSSPSLSRREEEALGWWAMALDFSQAYSDYLLSIPSSFPVLSYHRLLCILLQCSHHASLQYVSSCDACNETFFPILKEEVGAVLSYFNNRVKYLLRIHLASGVTKCIFRIKAKQARSHLLMIQDGQNLLKYVSMTTLATRKLLETYDKVHMSIEGSKFRTDMMTKHAEVLHSPWLVELLALYFNLKLKKNVNLLPDICPGSICDLYSGEPKLSCILQDSLKLEVDVTCSVCLEIMAEPVALKCGHLFCLKCACSVAALNKKYAKCPLCRESGVFAEVIRLKELNILINRRIPISA